MPGAVNKALRLLSGSQPLWLSAEEENLRYYMVCILSYIPNGRTVKRNILDIGLPPSCDPVKVWEVKVAAVKAPKALQR